MANRSVKRNLTDDSPAPPAGPVVAPPLEALSDFVILKTAISASGGRSGGREVVARHFGIQRAAVDGWVRTLKTSGALPRHIRPRLIQDVLRPLGGDLAEHIQAAMAEERRQAPARANVKEQPPWSQHKVQTDMIVAACHRAVDRLDKKKMTSKEREGQFWAVFRILEAFSGWTAAEWERLYKEGK